MSVLIWVIFNLMLLICIVVMAVSSNIINMAWRKEPEGAARSRCFCWCSLCLNERGIGSVQVAHALVLKSLLQG